ncbi:MAG: hypothetical protein AAF050_00345 [Cyanobacteria bacterium J06649_5]
MPRAINHDCKRCATEDVATAQAKSCWDADKPQRCYSKRAYYLKQAQNKAKKRSRQRAQRVGQIQDMEILPVGYTEPPEVQLLFFQDRADGKRHALQFTVFKDGEKIDGVKAIHLKGMSQKALRRHIKNVLGILGAKHNTQFAVSTARQPVRFCPLCLAEKKDKGDDGGAG